MYQQLYKMVCFVQLRGKKRLRRVDDPKISTSPILINQIFEGQEAFSTLLGNCTKHWGWWSFVSKAEDTMSACAPQALRLIAVIQRQTR